MSGSPLLVMRGICKRFGAVHALSEVDLEIREGETLGLVGSNGAGKSTLVKTIAGVHVPDSGAVEWKGSPVDLRRPLDAQRLGIATVHQNMSLCDNLDTVENLYLGRELRRFGMLNEVAMERRSRRLLESLSVDIPSLRVPVASLSGAQRQGVRVARALIGEPELVVLDEPTRALAPRQAALVLELVQRLREQRLGVLFVSDEMDEVRAVSDRVAVLRVGRNTGFFDTKYTTQEQLDSAITGNTAMAVSLQRSLLPHGLPEQDALDVGYRYLPAQAGVGGDWFDVIPLPGARVALVVGDIVGHGMHAAATMGRLRTAVHNFSMLDLPPDDLLAHLDDLVVRIDKDETAPGPRPAPPSPAPPACTRSTTRSRARCELARAGHLPPALVRPDGDRGISWTCPPVRRWAWAACPSRRWSAGCPRAASLVLYTDGLVEDRKPGHRRRPRRSCAPPWRDRADARPDVRGGARRAAARGPEGRHRAAHRPYPCVCPTTGSPAGTCRRARRRRRGTGAGRRPAGRWGLDDLAFTTELVLSELITNAIRHATAARSRSACPRTGR